MATRTSTLVANLRVRAIHAGLQTAEASFNDGGVTLSAGDVIQMVPIPHGAIVTQVMVTGAPGDASAGASLVLDVGTTADPDAFIDAGSLSISGVLQLSQKLGHGFRISISDDVVPHFGTINITVMAIPSLTTTTSLKLSVTYYMSPA